MSTVRLAALALLLPLAALAAPEEKPPGPLDELSYDELGKLVRQQRGKVVVVYLWSGG